MDDRGRIYLNGLRADGQPVMLTETTTPQAFEAAVDAALELWTERETPIPSCLLDEVEARGEHTLEEIGALLGLTRERVRQIETEAQLHLRKAAARHDVTPCR